MDPLRKVKAGDGVGRLLDTQTFNLVMDATKFYRGRMATKVGAGGVETDPLVPSCKVYIRNTTGSTLLPWSCVTPTGVAPIDPETLPVNANNQPVFEVQAPAATTDPVLITMEPIAVDAIGEAAALGVCVAQVNVTDGAHRFAVPQVGSTASLASAASGPVRILAPWNTGNSTRLVMLCGQAAAAASGGSITVKEVDGTPSYASTTTIQFDQADGFVLTQPSGGIARVDQTPADATHVGYVTTIAQTFSGVKTFLNNVIVGTAPTTIYANAVSYYSSIGQKEIVGSNYTSLYFGSRTLDLYHETSGLFSGYNALTVDSPDAVKCLIVTRSGFGIGSKSFGMQYEGGTATVNGLTFRGGLYISGGTPTISGGSF